MSHTMDFCRDCGKQVFGKPRCYQCTTKATGWTETECRECERPLHVNDATKAGMVVCEPCETQLKLDMMSEREFPHGEFPNAREEWYDEREEDFWGRGLDQQAYD